MAGAIVQSVSANVTGAGGGATLALPSPTTAGNCLILAVAGYDTGTSPGWPFINDAFNTWYPGADQWSWSVFSGVTQIQYAPNIAARSSFSIFVDLPNCEYQQMFLMEVSGIKAAAPTEVNNVAEGQAAGSTARSGSVTPGVASFLVAAVTEDTGSLVSAVSAGWTERYDGSTGQPLHVATRSGAASTAAECVFTAATSFSSSAGVILGLEETAGGGVSELGAAAIAGAGGVAVTARRTRRALTTIAAIGSLATVARRVRPGLALVGGAGAVAVSARSARRGAVVISGTSGVAALGTEVAPAPELGAVSIAGSSSLAASATSKRRTTVLIAGVSALSTSAFSSGPRRGAVRIDAFGRLVVSGVRGRPGRGTASIVTEARTATAVVLDPRGTTIVGGIE